MTPTKLDVLQRLKILTCSYGTRFYNHDKKIKFTNDCSLEYKKLIASGIILDLLMGYSYPEDELTEDELDDLNSITVDELNALFDLLSTYLNTCLPVFGNVAHQEARVARTANIPVLLDGNTPLITEAGLQIYLEIKNNKSQQET